VIVRRFQNLNIHSDLAPSMQFFSMKMTQVNGRLIHVSQTVAEKCLQFLGDCVEHDYHQDMDEGDNGDNDDDGGGYEPEFLPPKALPQQDSHQLMSVAHVRAAKLFEVMGVSAADALAF
jgi:hypothetical protein